jgi:hypothetical protein
VGYAKQILQGVGIFIAAAGVVSLPSSGLGPKGLTQSLFARLAITGAFTRHGLVLILVGLGCLVVAMLLPSDRE